MSVRRPSPAFVLGSLAAANAVPAYALLVLGPEIAASLGIGPGTLGAFAILQAVAFTLAASAFAVAGARRPRRVALSVGAAAAWSAASAGTAVAAAPGALAAALTADGAAGASIRALHPALVADMYPRERRMRALSAHRAVAAAGSVLAPGIVAVLTDAAGLTWRGVFLAAAGVSAAVAVLGLTLRDPGPTGAEPGLRPEPLMSRLSLGGGFAALGAAPGVRRILVGYAVGGAFGVPFLAYLSFFLEDVWALAAGERGLLLAATAAVTVVTALLWGPTAERLLAAGAAALTDAAWRLVLLGIACLPAAVLAPWFGVMTAGVAVLLAALALAQTSLTGVLVTTVPPELRAHAAAAAGIAFAVVGGLPGLLLFQGADEPLGPAGALAMLAVPGAIAAAVLRSAVSLVAVDEAQLEKRIARRTRRTQGARAAPAIECEAMAVRFAGVRALEGMTLCVHPGESVALLGTNGAGKSTLLRALAGLLQPTEGDVRIDGHEATWLTAEQRAELGLRLVVGGHGVFGTLTPRQALALAARAARRPPSVAAEALAAFPPLATRADVPARRLSGGEQQMLALAQALLARPRILLVDELSLGLAPEAVDAVVAQVRALASAGAAVVTAEQSVAVGRAVADRVVFLDAGRLRFDGTVAAFADRDDLLSPVLLAAWDGAPPGHEGATTPGR